MAALDVLNNTAELDLTPSRKRKRQFDRCEIQEQQNALKTTAAAAATSCFTNAAFSSTPKKILGKRRLQLKTDKENAALTYPNQGLEVKSIAELARRQEEPNTIPQNPYEVLRKPPKKKKRQTEASGCFENPALNLELPEKQFNPYEVVREITPNKAANCFSNPGLNLKIQDASAIRNPFEVQRELPGQDMKNPFEIPSETAGNGLSTPKPCKLKLGLPFVPTVGCRIDFKDLSMSQLTPSKLLAEKLVFSPVPKPKVSLGSIGEETTMDIGKELDLYQLELENSINEAKLRKNGVTEEELMFSPIETNNYQIQVTETEKKSKFTQKLCGISEDGENEEIVEETTTQTEKHIEVEVVVQKEEVKTMELKETNPFLYDLSQQFQRTETAEVIEIENLDELYGYTADDQEEDEEEDSFDFKTPAPFVRAYTKPEEPKLTVSRESLETNKNEKTDKSGEVADDNKKSMNVKNIIRKSIRKLMHPHGQQEKGTENDLAEKPDNEKQNGLMNAIRHSLRRKPSKNVPEEETVTKECEISIIDGTERTMKLKSEALETEYVKIEDLTNEKKHNLRNSIRKSTREVRNHLMKSVFHKKHEEYDFYKN